MTTIINKIKQERAKAVKDARALIEKAESENRNLNTEEKEQYSKIEASIEEFEERIERAEESEAISRSLKEFDAESRGKFETAEKKGQADEQEESRERLFRAFLQGPDALRKLESRDLSAGNFGAGGALVAPKKFVAGVLRAVEQAVLMRQIGTVYTLEVAQSLGVVSLESEVSDADWTPEVPAADLSPDTSMKFGGRELNPNDLTKLVKVSKALLAAATVGPEAIVQESIARKFRKAEENGFMNGSGVKQPLGIFTANAQGITTSQDVTTGAANGIAFDGLINAIHDLDAEYQARATWVLGKGTIKAIRKLKDKQDQYIWEPSVRAGEPDVLFSAPVKKSAYAPDTLTDGLYCGVVGDFSYYWIADSMQMSLQRLDELFALRRQVGFLATKATDGAPVMAAAFRRLKVGA